MIHWMMTVYFTLRLNIIVFKIFKYYGEEERLAMLKAAAKQNSPHGPSCSQIIHGSTTLSPASPLCRAYFLDESPPRSCGEMPVALPGSWTPIELLCSGMSRPWAF
jgi:hypothetical protein